MIWSGIMSQLFSDPLALCKEHSLDLLEVFPATNGSRFVGRVRDTTGTELLIKAAKPDLPASFGEAQALAYWEGIQGVPRLVQELEPGVFLREFVEGPTLADLADGGIYFAGEVGALAQRIHLTPPASMQQLSKWMTTVAEKLKLRKIQGDMAAAFAYEVLEAQLGRGFTTPVTLHGDYWPSNIILSPDGLFLIDPYGYAGPAAFDLASFVIATPSDNCARLLASVLRGYGSAPLELGSIFSWFAVSHLRFLEDRHQQTHHLPGLVEALMKFSNPEDWVIQAQENYS